jgi:sporulation protein YlmC with PRC-barrel domain
MHDLRARLEDMEIVQRRTASIGDLSDSDNEIEAEREEEVAVEDASNERLIRAIDQNECKRKDVHSSLRGKLGCRGATRLD